MNKILTTLALAAAAFAAQAQAPAAGDPGTVKFSVNGMVCAFCAQGIEKRLTRMTETGPLYINLAQKVVAVEPKPGMRIDIDRVKAEIVEAGYDVTAAQPVPMTVAAIRAQMRSR
jgi:periplasmic mercuric ion binding protein